MPDLSQPYSSDGERYSAFAQLISYEFAIEALTELAELPSSQWSTTQTLAFPSQVPGGPPEHPQQRLQRWLTLFRQEIDTIRDVRNRLVHPGLVTVTDAEIRGATWLA